MRTLPNGLTVVAQEWHRSPLVAIRAYVKAGSVYEAHWPGSGVSHFVEHVIEDGTARRTRDQIRRIEEDLGNNANAYTSHDHTCYYMTTLPSLLPQAVDVMADYLTGATFPESEVEVQRGIILNEFRLGYDDPDTEVSKLLYKTMYREHLARFPIIGDEEQFRALKRQDVLDYYHERYRPEDMVVVMVGDLGGEAMVQEAEQVFGGWTPPARPTAGVSQGSDEPAQTEFRRASEEKDVQADYLEIGFHTIPLTLPGFGIRNSEFGMDRDTKVSSGRSTPDSETRTPNSDSNGSGQAHPDLFALDLSATILGQGPSSRLYQKLYTEMGLVQSIEASSYTPTFPGVFAISAVLKPQDQARAEDVILQEIEKIKTVPVPRDELVKAQTTVERSFVFPQETVEGRAAQLGTDVLTTGDPEFTDKYIRGIRSVTPQDIQRVAAKYLRTENATIVALVPTGAAASLPKGMLAVPETERTAQRPGPMHLTRFSNGIQVITRYDASTPTVAVVAAFPGGVRYENDATNGTFSLLSRLLTRGTATRSDQEIALAMDRLGGSLSGFSGNNSFGLRMEVLADSLDEAMEIFADCLRNSNLPEDRLEIERANLLEEIARREDDWYAFGSDWMRQALFRSYPYRLSPAGTAESVSHVTREDLLAAYRRYANPRSLVLTVFGAVPSDRVLSELHRLLDDWAGPPPAEVRISPEPPHGHEIRVSREKPGFTQAIVYMGYLGQSLSAADVYAVDVLDAALSGIGLPGGRLHNRLRNSKLVYVVHFFPVRGPDTGYLGLYAACRPDDLERVLSAIDEELDRLIQKGLEEGELDRAKRMCLLGFASQHQTNSDQAQEAAFDEMFGLGYRYALAYPRRIQAVTAEQVIAAAQRYLNPNDRALVTVVPSPEKGNGPGVSEPSH